MPNYLITITRAGGLTDEQQVLLTHHFAKTYQYVVLNYEAHKSGLIHVHATVEAKCAKTWGVRKPLVRFLEKIGIEVGPKTLIIRLAHDDGALTYVVKEVTDLKPVTLCQGWKIEDLLEKRKEALKKLTKVQILGNDKIVGQDEAVPLIIKFARTTRMPITDKHSFIEVMKVMCKAGFGFSRVKKKDTYAEVLCRLGSDAQLEDLWECELIGLR